MGSLLVRPSEPVAVMPGFPETLGPFAVARAPFEGGDFKIKPASWGAPAKFPLMGEDQGTAWMMERYVLERCGIDAGGRHRIFGQFSPRHQVTLNSHGKAAAKIPAEARTFVFSYPVQDWKEVGKQAAEAAVPFQPPPMAATSAAPSETPRATPRREEVSKAGSFLSVGGFVYLDKDYNILAATTLMAPKGLPGGLSFSPPRPWKPEWTGELNKQKRFQPVTIKALVDAGARHFCWLRPGEFFPNLKRQPSVQHGGFVYLFGKDPGTEHELDRYFAVLFDGDNISEADNGTVAVVCNVVGLGNTSQNLVPFKLKSEPMSPKSITNA